MTIEQVAAHTVAGIGYSAQEIELKPAAASFQITVKQCESMYRQYNLSTPVSGTETALRDAREFMRVANLLAVAEWP